MASFLYYCKQPWTHNSGKFWAKSIIRTWSPYAGIGNYVDACLNKCLSLYNLNVFAYLIRIHHLFTKKNQLQTIESQRSNTIPNSTGNMSYYLLQNAKTQQGSI